VISESPVIIITCRRERERERKRTEKEMVGKKESGSKVGRLRGRE
jgi:hypothetical protein